MTIDNEIQVYKGDEKTIKLAVYTDYFKTEPLDMSGYTSHLKVDGLFELDGTIFGTSRNNIQFDLTSTQSNYSAGNYIYTIYIQDISTDEVRTIDQGAFEIIAKI